MCYSAQIRADYKRFFHLFGGVLSLREFVKLYGKRKDDPKISIPKAVDAAFGVPQSDEEREIKWMIDTFNAAQASRLEQDLFKQRKRLADAQRTLQTKVTKKANEDVRIATDKIARDRAKLADLSRTDLPPRDARIFPGSYAPVMIWEDGRFVVVPMRYQCRPEGKPAFYDTKLPGLYNARRDNLERFWKQQFGHTHAIMAADLFYEHVMRDGKDIVLEFKPQHLPDMLVACLWSRWTGPDGEELLSFAAITDEPPEEVAATGHDRCIVPIKPENVEAWLRPDPSDLAAQFAILDDRERPYYEHRLVA
ncbi:SOS response-associated peptidase family protein [Variovorax gossypii]|jgi:putative SOS response-associated peptidase YedK